MDVELGECSICGLQDEFLTVQRHFEEEHLDKNEYMDINEEENVEGSTLVSIKWNCANIKLLLGSYKDHLHLFKSAKKTNKSIWQLIAQKVNDEGYEFTGDQCDMKFRNLKKTYKRIKDSNNKTGRGATSWLYFSIFEELFGKEPDVAPVCITSNTSGTKYIGSNDASSSSEHSQCSSRAEDVDSVDGQKTLSKFSRKRKSNEQPQWLDSLRKDATDRHNEKMSLLKELINVLKEK